MYCFANGRVYRKNGFDAWICVAQEIANVDGTLAWVHNVAIDDAASNH